LASYVKELLFDYAHGRLDIHQRIDLTMALEHLPKKDLELLDLYLAGYNAMEIAYDRGIQLSDVELSLEHILHFIEERTGYSDQQIIHKVVRLKKYSQRRINEFRVFLKRHSTQFMIHDTPIYRIQIQFDS